MFHVKVHPAAVSSHQIGHTMLLSVCVFACLRARGLTAVHLASQWTMEMQLRVGSAQMSLHSQVPWCMTLFPVTFPAINLWTYGDGALLLGCTVFK